MSHTIPTIDSITLAHVIGGAGQPGSIIGDAAKRATGTAYEAGRWLGQRFGAGQPPSAPSTNTGLSPIRPGMSGLAIRERLDNKGI